jgi:hypothetical protein
MQRAKKPEIRSTTKNPQNKKILQKKKIEKGGN